MDGRAKKRRFLRNETGRKNGCILLINRNKAVHCRRTEDEHKSAFLERFLGKIDEIGVDCLAEANAVRVGQLLS
jgi:hypothetical protein